LTPSHKIETNVLPYGPIFQVCIHGSGNLGNHVG
jgi:hypothetical protein